MAITYTWKVTGLKKTNEGDNTDAVVQTYWTKSGSDEHGNKGVFQGATPFTSVDANPFVPLESLTETKVLNWIKAVVNADINYKEYIDKEIQKQIDQVAIVHTDMPWEHLESRPADAAAEGGE
jgi:hypothetical protein